MDDTVADLPPQGQLASVNGIELYYEAHGAGSPLLLLHHFTGTSGSWQPYVDDLAQEYRLVIPDIRGHGRSANPANRFSHRQSALDLFALLDQLGIDRYAAIGNSWGGMTLLNMATQRPARIEAMALMATAGKLGRQGRNEFRSFSTQPGTALWDYLRQHHPYGDDQIRALFDQTYDLADNHAEMNFTPTHLSAIAAPTLVIGGDRDRFFPVPAYVETYTSLPNAYLWIVPSASHSGVWGRMQALMPDVLAFLRGDWEAN